MLSAKFMQSRRATQAAAVRQTRNKTAPTVKRKMFDLTSATAGVRQPVVTARNDTTRRKGLSAVAREWRQHS